MPLALLLTLAAADHVATLIDAARAKIVPETGCRATNTTDVTVCGLRRADRLRVPLVVRTPGDPRYEAVAAERERLLARTTPVEEHSTFLVGGGMAGVSASVGSDGAVGAATLRPLAP